MTVVAETPVSRELPPSMVERMTLIFDAFHGRSTRLTLEDIARATQLPRSTAHRILDQLVKLNWLDHSRYGYSLGRRALHLGGAVDDTSELRSAASPYLHSLMLRTGLTVHLAVLDGGEVRYLDKLGARRAVSVPSRVGSRAPAHCTALGKSMLAWIPAEDVDDRVGRQIEGRTGRSIVDLDELHHELHRIRARRGLAIEREECFEDITCVAAAIHAPEGPIGAISLVGDSSTPLERIAPVVLEASQRISQELFGDLTPRARRMQRTA